MVLPMAGKTQATISRIRRRVRKSLRNCFNSGRGSLGATSAGAFHLDHASRHAESQVGGILGEQLLDPRILRFRRHPAVAANEEKTIMATLGMRAGDIGVAALDLRDESLGHQELKRPVDCGRSDRTGVPELQCFDQLVGAHWPTTLPEQFQDLPPERRQLRPARVAERHCQRNPFSRHMRPAAVGIGAGLRLGRRRIHDIYLNCAAATQCYNIAFFDYKGRRPDAVHP